MGDCSGGFSRFGANTSVYVFPVLNLHHGTKLDLFVNRICTAEYILVCDDDVFLLDNLPLEWAIKQFENDTLISVISFMPRCQKSSVLRDKVDKPMGSYCLILRRDIWKRENLSFKIVDPKPNKYYDWFYDTADYANVQLLKRGYKILVAPPEIRRQLITFEGTSTWGLKIQESGGNIANKISGSKIKIRKAFCTILMLKALNELINNYYTELKIPYILQNHMIIKAESECIKFLSEEEITSLSFDINEKIMKIRDRLQFIMPFAV